MTDRLLIVDDDPDFTAYFATVTKAAGYEVLEINDPTRFEGALRSWSPTHVVIDLNMPTIDGVEALQILVRHRSRAKIVICSGAARDFLSTVHRLGGRFGLTMSRVLQKPVSPKELKAFLESIAGEREPTTSIVHAFDKVFFNEVCNTMGREWVIRGLKDLTYQIESTFPKENLASVDRVQLAQRAHRLASSAGMFGFSELSQLCRELEESCSKDGDFSSSLHRAQIAAHAARMCAYQNIVQLTEQPDS